MNRTSTGVPVTGSANKNSPVIPAACAGSSSARTGVASLNKSGGFPSSSSWSTLRTETKNCSNEERNE
ncbi:unnamed protein product [Amoebophrya sp. A25]|nr:unnamed protein product [Amoebophrya sp. A25]|eukprot:GSA25T00019862001.1